MKREQIKDMLKNSRAIFWNSILETERAKSLILSNYSKDKNFQPTRIKNEYFPKEKNSVLDFGCGLGRNFPDLLEKFKKVDGYDLPNMINLVPDDAKKSINFLSSDWEEIRKNKYDLIYAVLVLQHIDEIYLREYLVDFSSMSSNLLIGSRNFLDDKHENKYKNILKIILEYYDIVKITSDPINIIETPPEHNLHFQALLVPKSNGNE